MLLGELALSQYDCSASLTASNILAIVIDSSFVEQTAELRNKSWKPECVLVYYRICTLRHIRIEIYHGSQNVF
jgi:hypothetical protein